MRGTSFYYKSANKRRNSQISPKIASRRNQLMDRSAPVAIGTASCLNSFENLLRCIAMTHLLAYCGSFQMCPQNQGKTSIPLIDSESRSSSQSSSLSHSSKYSNPSLSYAPRLPFRQAYVLDRTVPFFAQISHGGTWATSRMNRFGIVNVRQIRRRLPPNRYPDPLKFNRLQASELSVQHPIFLTLTIPLTPLSSFIDCPVRFLLNCRILH